MYLDKIIINLKSKYGQKTDKGREKLVNEVFNFISKYAHEIRSKIQTISEHYSCDDSARALLKEIDSWFVKDFDC